MKNFIKLMFFIATISFTTAQTTTNFSSAEGYANGTGLENNANWGGRYFSINTSSEFVTTPSNTAEAFWGQPQALSTGEKISFEVDMRFTGDLNYSSSTLVFQIGFNVGGTTSSGGSDRQFIYLKALTTGKLQIVARNGTSLISTPVFTNGKTIDTWKNQDLTVKVSFELGTSAANSVVTARLINRTTGEFTDAAFDQNGVVTNVFNQAVIGTLFGFVRTVTLQDGNSATTEKCQISSVKLIDEDTLFPNTFNNSSGDDQWSTPGNWDSGNVPSSYTDVTISSGQAIEAENTTTALANTIVVNSGGSLTIDETSSLTVSGDFTNSGTVTLDSTEDDYSSLIVEGTATGNIVYNRYVNSYDTNLGGGGWDLVGTPAGMTIANFTAANAGTLKVLGNDYAFSQYDNALGQWERYPTASPSGSFTAAQGYSMATNAGDGATVAFTGPMQTTSQSINIIDNNDANGGAGRRWNLVSNPFPSYIKGNTAAGATNFLGVNTAAISNDYKAVYGWDGTQYVPKNLTDAQGFSIAPGQGFWVAAASTSPTPVSFTPDMRTTTGTGDFVTGPELLSYNVVLKLYNGETQKATTKFYFKAGLSLDLDPGYDAGAFNQLMKLSTKLAGGSNPIAFSINAMGMDAMQNTRVPLEIRQNAGQAFTISIADMDLPEDIYVYLEDTVNGTFTSLKDQDFALEPQSDLSGVDRFFIVFKSNSVLSSGDTLGLGALNVYKANNDSFVSIAGITPELGQLDVTIYNILGVTVREKSLNPATTTQRVSTQGLASGLYVVQIKSGNQTTVKKVIVK